MIFWFCYLVAPSLVGLCIGLSLALLVCDLRARRFVHALLWSGLVALFAFAYFFGRYDDIRLWSQDWLMGLTVALGAWLMGRRPRGDSRHWRLTVPLLAAGGVCAALLFLSAVFSMHPLEQHEVKSPDGRYDAYLVYYDGLTFGYYYIAVRRTGFWARLGPVHEVAEAAAEGFDDIHWADNHTLALNYDKGTEFAQQDRRWYDIRFIYHPQ